MRVKGGVSLKSLAGLCQDFLLLSVSLLETDVSSISY